MNGTLARAAARQWLPTRTDARVRPTWACIALYVITLGTYSFYWYYRLHKEHDRRIGVDRPAEVVMLHVLVPIVVFVPLLWISAWPSRFRYEQASDLQRLGWFVALVVAAYSHWVVATVNHRLSERLDELARRRIGPTDLRERASWVVVAIALAFVATFLPRLERWGFFDLPDWAGLVTAATSLLSVYVLVRWWKGANDVANALAGWRFSR